MVKASLPFALTIALIASAPVVPAREAGTSGTLSVAFAGQPGVLSFDAPGFTVDTNETKPDGRRYLKGEFRKTGVIFSVFLEHTSRPATQEECRQAMKRKAEANLPFKKADIRFSDFNGMQTLDYRVPEAQGMPVMQGNTFACLAVGNFYADIHLSKVQFQPADQELFTAILKTVRFSEAATADNLSSVGAPPPGSALEYMGQGSRLYLAQKYAEAIPPYQKALDLEKQSPRLDHTMWRVLVDNLGMAYGMSGDLPRSKETFEYGISKEASYPLFHYNLACTYAEMKDLDHALVELRLAYQYKQNMIPGEGFPDPRKDDSFKRFLKDPRFVEFLKSVE